MAIGNILATRIGMSLLVYLGMFRVAVMVYSQINAFPEDIGSQAHKLFRCRNELRETAYELYEGFLLIFQNSYDYQ